MIYLYWPVNLDLFWHKNTENSCTQLAYGSCVLLIFQVLSFVPLHLMSLIGVIKN